MLRIYRYLLCLYPAAHREQFGEEMIAVFQDIQAATVSRGIFARTRLCLRETAGLLSGALLQHIQALTGSRVWLPLQVRRFTMRTEFRFPKSTALLMTMILAGIIWAIEKGKAIQASLPAVNPSVGPIQPSHNTFLPSVALIFLFFYAAGLIGWAILFALHRSGVHRLADVADQK